MTSIAMELRHAGGGPTGAPGIAARLVASVLRVPLMVKVLGANLLIVAAVLAEQYAFPGGSVLMRSLSVVSLSFAATAILVWLALRPIALLESTAERVSGGDYGARTPLSPVADRSVGHLANTMNRLLDRVEA
ncbi:MAG TPA: HAMP domain-containing protein, partial [Gemmatimonadaceae bacterium]